MLGALPARALVASIFAVVIGCSSESGSIDQTRRALRDDAITVASFDFLESRLLAEIYAQALESAEFDVVRAFGLGPREFVSPALAQGLVELVPEYSGTALQFLSLSADSSSTDRDDSHSALRRAARALGITVLAAAPARDANTFVVTRKTADDKRLRRISDLASVDDELTFGGPPECPTRPLCLAGLSDVYGLEFKEFVRLDAGGPVTRQALQNEDVDIALLFTTDPAIGRSDLVELEDDRGLQPAENVTPLVRDEVVDRWGDRVTDVIDSVSGDLTTRALRELNGLAAEPDGDIGAIASDWLRAGEGA
jgi:osmoprotectant transport system substrate-binding protein